MEYVFGDITVACSNVDRVVFPDDGITKGEVIAYYHDVAALIVPELRGRPGAPVSAPIAWSELDDPALRADGIRLRDLRARLDRRGDPWHALRARAGSVRAARRALAALTDAENLAPG